MADYIILGLLYAIFLYGSLPWLLARLRKKPITRKKYKRACIWGTVAIWFVFTVITVAAGGEPLTGAAAFLWTPIFYRNGIKKLRSKGLFLENITVSTNENGTKTNSKESEAEEKTSLSREIKINCPKCGEQITATVFQSINTKYSPNVAETIINGKRFDATCTKCGFVSNLEYDVLYHDLKHKAMIWVIHKNEEYKQKIEEVRATKIPACYTTRIVYDMSGLREKVACLEAGKDDRIVELCKVYLLNEVNRQHPEFEVTSIFYTYQHGKSVVFFYNAEGNQISCVLDEDVYKIMADSHKEKLISMRATPYPVIDYEWAVDFCTKKIENTTEVAEINPYAINEYNHEESQRSECEKTLEAPSAEEQLQNQKRQKKKTIGVVLPCILVFGIGSLLMVYISSYNTAVKYAEAGKYKQASEAIMWPQIVEKQDPEMLQLIQAGEYCDEGSTEGYTTMKQLKENGYAPAVQGFEKYQSVLYKKAVKEYRDGNTEEARELFATVAPYKESRKYLTLILPGNLDELLDIIEFENAKQIIMNKGFALPFLKGKWVERSTGKDIVVKYKNGKWDIQYSLPHKRIKNTTAEISEGIIWLVNSKDDSKTECFQIEIINIDEISVFCYADESNRTMERKN